MVIDKTIRDILGRRRNPYIYAAPPTPGHKWPFFMGVELELEEVHLPSGNPIYAGMDLDEFPYHEHEDWDMLDDEERDERYDEWRRNQGVSNLAGWTQHSDASLRNGVEFVTTPAVGGADMEQRIDAFYGRNLTYTNGPRTSTHIHIDMTEDRPEVLQSLVMLVYVIEDALYRVIGEGRKFAGYSMPLVEMPQGRLRNLLNPASEQLFRRAIDASQNRERYYGLNISVARHGTVEFRYFPGGPTKEELTSWIDLITYLKAAAIAHSPDSLVDNITSPHELELFLHTHLKEWAPRLIDQCSVDRMFEFFEEIEAIRSGNPNYERDSSVLNFKESFLNTLLTKAYADQPAAQQHVINNLMGRSVTLEDAYYYVQTARQMFSAPDADDLRTSRVFYEDPVAREHANALEALMGATEPVRFTLTENGFGAVLVERYS